MHRVKRPRLCVAQVVDFICLSLDAEPLAPIFRIGGKMAKVVKIEQAFILKDGVMLKLSKGVLKIHHGKVVPTPKGQSQKKEKSE
jgi:hypothetical protein